MLHHLGIQHLTNMCIYIYICMYVYVYLYHMYIIYIYISLYIYIHISEYVYIYIYIYIILYIYMYMFCSFLSGTRHLLQAGSWCHRATSCCTCDCHAGIILCKCTVELLLYIILQQQSSHAKFHKCNMEETTMNEQ